MGEKHKDEPSYAQKASDQAHATKEQAKQGAQHAQESASRGAQQAKESTEAQAQKAKGAAEDSGSYIGGTRRLATHQPVRLALTLRPLRAPLSAALPVRRQAVERQGVGQGDARPRRGEEYRA